MTLLLASPRWQLKQIIETGFLSLSCIMKNCDFEIFLTRRGIDHPVCLFCMIGNIITWNFCHGTPELWLRRVTVQAQLNHWWLRVMKQNFSWCTSTGDSFNAFYANLHSFNRYSTKLNNMQNGRLTIMPTAKVQARLRTRIFLTELSLSAHSVHRLRRSYRQRAWDCGPVNDWSYIFELSELKYRGPSL